MGSYQTPKKQQIPIIDFAKYYIKPGTSEWHQTCKEVRQALEGYGCFMVENYEGFSSKLRGSVLDALKELFDLPLEVKMKNKYEKPMNGYVGQIPKIPLHESLGVENSTSLEATRDFTHLMWPNGNDQFCERIHEYAKATAELDQLVARMIFESYGVEKHYDPYINSTLYLLRLLKNRAPKMGEPNLGFITHTDKSFTTILNQYEVDALEVDTIYGEKINVHFSPSSFVVIAGDALMAWSNDRIKSPAHRVIMNGEVDRYSTGLFAFNTGTIQIHEELVDEEHPLKYKPFDHIGLLYFYRTTEGYRAECPIKAYCGV